VASTTVLMATGMPATRGFTPALQS
jgi:hypothetical protein